MPSVLLRQKAKEHGASETILTRDGYITEGAASNIFACIDGEILTPPKTNYVLSGITRDLVVEILLSNNLIHQEKSISEDVLFDADEIWVTSSTWEIVPIVELDNKLIGDGKPGPVWLKVNQLYQEFKHNYCN